MRAAWGRVAEEARRGRARLVAGGNVRGPWRLQGTLTLVVRRARGPVELAGVLGDVEEEVARPRGRRGERGCSGSQVRESGPAALLEQFALGACH